jgi:alkaline phosphatase
MGSKLYFISPILFGAIICLNWDCKKSDASYSHKTKNVIIVVVDGARYTETWGLTSRALIPNRSALLNEGVLCTNFYNNGYTFTNAGHTAICTGVYQYIDNYGEEIPQHPSIFQYWLKQTKKSADNAWIIASKDKLTILSDCLDSDWKGKYLPKTDCGNNGPGTGYREDSITFKHVKNIMQNNHPGLMLINFKEPDASGHANDTAGYVRGIIDTDKYIRLLWELIQNDSVYKDQTTLIVTNDHGRHTAGHLDGFVSHTDKCEGCKHIEFFALGPDFRKNYVCEKPHDQIDIANTVGELLGFSIPTSNGKAMKEFFK